MRQQHAEGEDIVTAITSIKTRLSELRRKERLEEWERKYVEYVRREWSMCFECMDTLERLLEQHDIPLPSPFPLLGESRVEDPPSAEYWSTKWQKKYDPAQYASWKNLGFISDSEGDEPDAHGGKLVY